MARDDETTTPHLALAGITKRFGATVALDGVDLEIQAGSVHAVIGENGAGKSTLGKVIAGVHVPDAGTMLLDGEPAAFRSPRQALERSVTTIAQELSLLPARSVLDNVFLGMESHRGPFLDRRAARARYAALAERTGIAIPADAPVGALPLAVQQQVEILRALARDARLVVMDEPTARLSATEAAQLRGIVRALADDGRTIVYVSHFLDEVLALADAITVLRDGRLVRTAPAAAETPASLVEAMVGRALSAAFPARRPVAADAPVVLRASGLARRGAFADVSLAVRAGEIVGVAGLVGAGRTEVARAILGADPLDAGTVEVDGRPAPRGVGAMLKGGVAFVPESRKEQGLLLRRPVRENVTLPHLRGLTRLGLVRRGRERAAAAAGADAAGVRRASDELPVAALSGGNQQKVLFARAFIEQPRVLIADEPTRGVDVAAKRAIYDLIAGAAADGMGVLLISSELEEVLGLAHRVLVMREGRIVEELDAAEATEQRVMTAAFGAEEVPA